ncbi:hypothetical protein ABZ816_12640 [Actinosynnema sp. NPDC047251]|uniref:Uncharacterized protein n=1 Tax=Saccharothrix espanaensis (strain ATCC 51144 / DSM 44229 / JCM 9112 / NBRC 15066 / NRRL 15764) TaxID=1179773 RepID=K0KFY8_SACES|nr:hypothetical protein [Saccharothrix espanaensis]CCH35443.1 hypothetical protein BN6_82260 [Saccharothrix espanaensis DSM 44229]
MTDIRQTLETAFDDEPPLTLDVAAIREAGRRRVAVRRSLTTVAALAAVTAVCVPAMLGSSGSSGSSGDVRVGGQPSSAVVTTSPSAGPGSSSRVTPPAPPKPATAARAAELTELLATSGVLPDVPAAGVPGNPGGAWEFAVSQGGYKAVTALTGERKGQVLVTLYAQDFGCGGGNVEHVTCEMRWFDGVAVVVVDFRNGPTHAVTASTRAVDGTVFSVTAVNTDDRAESTGPDAPLTVGELAKVATLPGVSF